MGAVGALAAAVIGFLVADLRLVTRLWIIGIVGPILWLPVLAYVIRRCGDAWERRLLAALGLCTVGGVLAFGTLFVTANAYSVRILQEYAGDSTTFLLEPGTAPVSFRATFFVDDPLRVELRCRPLQAQVPPQARLIDPDLPGLRISLTNFKSPESYVVECNVTGGAPDLVRYRPSEFIPGNADIFRLGQWEEYWWRFVTFGVGICIISAVAPFLGLLRHSHSSRRQTSRAKDKGKGVKDKHKNDSRTQDA